MGTYEFQNGCFYVGEWHNHKMQGEGTFIDQNAKKWQGNFVNGVFRSSNQRKLRLEKIIEKRETEIKKESLKYFDEFIRILGQSDKKALKELIEVLFITPEQAEKFISEPYVQFLEKKLEEWAEIIEYIQKPDEINILKHKSGATQLKPDQISSTQFKGVGQIVEFVKETRLWVAKCSLLEIEEGKWVMVHYKEKRDEDSKKKGKKKK